ncbi:MAG: WYL domain-containing protein [Anaerolineae bacterium]
MFRETPTTVIRRCLALLRRLQRGPATKEELIQAVFDALDPEVYGNATGRSLDRRFERDKRKLRDVFGLELHYHRSTGEYELVNAWESLLDLPDEALRAIAFLQETFTADAPGYELVQPFLAILIGYLSPERRGALDRQRTALEVMWSRRDDEEVDPAVERGLRKALLERRRVAFDYASPYYEAEEMYRHVVDPWLCYFDSTLGHFYLRAYCRQITDPCGETRLQQGYRHYRLGRIHNLMVLPDKLPPFPPTARTYPLTYRLAPVIARRGEVTRHPGITILEKEPQEDGSIVVHAETENVWWAIRSLLHYGASCEVLGGPEARYEMEKVVKAMAGVYLSDSGEVG